MRVLQDLLTGKRSGRRGRALLLLLLPWCAWSAPVAEVLTVPAANAARPVALGTHAQWYRDRAATLTLEQALVSTDFELSRTATLNFGVIKDPVWIRVAFSNPGPRERSLILNAASSRVSRLDYWMVRGRGEVLLQGTTGIDFPFAQRPIQHREFLLPLLVPAHSAVTVVLRLHTTHPKTSALLLHTTRSLREQIYEDQWIRGLYFGILLVALVYNLFLYASVRDRAYLAYSAYVLALGSFMAQAVGYSYQYLWPDLVRLNLALSPILGALVVVLAGAFAVTFLDLRSVAPRLRRVIWGLAAFTLALSPFTPVLPLPGIVSFLAFPMTALLVAAGIIALRSGYRPARYFLFGFGIFLVFSTAFLVHLRGGLELPWTPHRALELGSALEVVILSLGLGDRINNMREKNRLLQLRESERREEKRRFDTEMSLARQIQRALLPRSAPECPGLRLAARYVPADAVGGDLYDFVRIDERSVGVLLTDVAGHGVPAALVSGMLKVSSANHVRLAADPGEFMSALNKSMLERAVSSFATGVYGVFDLSRRVLEVSNAGHPGLLHLREGSLCTEHRPYGRILGVFDDAVYEVVKIPLEAGDRIILFTDGLTEAASMDNELFGTERLEAHLVRLAEEHPEATCDQLLFEVRRWAGPAGLDDDLTLVVADVYEA